MACFVKVRGHLIVEWFWLRDFDFGTVVRVHFSCLHQHLLSILLPNLLLNIASHHLSCFIQLLQLVIEKSAVAIKEVVRDTILQ